MPACLPFAGPLVQAAFVSRQKRFLIEAEGKDGRFIAHANNTGSMLGLLRPGAAIWLSVSDSPKRKLAHTLEMVRVPDFRGGFFAGVNTLTPNRLFKAAFGLRLFPDLAGYTSLKSEPRFAGGRLDFRLTGPAGTCLVEAKNVTLVEDDAAMFPDAATSRGRKHLLELTRLCREGEARAACFFLVQRPDGRCFAPAEVVDPEYAALFREALHAGVLMLPYRAEVSPAGIRLGERLPLGRWCF